MLLNHWSAIFQLQAAVYIQIIRCSETLCAITEANVVLRNFWIFIWVISPRAENDSYKNGTISFYGKIYTSLNISIEGSQPRLHRVC